MFDFVTSSIKVCCFEVNEDFRIASSHFSYLLILTFRPGKLLDCLIRRASVFHQHAKVRSVRRPTFTSTRLDTTLVLRVQLSKNSRTKKKGFGCIGLLATSPLSAKTDSQLKLPKSQLNEKPTRCWQQTLSQVKGQLRPPFFQPYNVPRAEFKEVSLGSDMDQQTTCTGILGNSNASQHNEVL